MYTVFLPHERTTHVTKMSIKPIDILYFFVDHPGAYYEHNYWNYGQEKSSEKETSQKTNKKNCEKSS